ncbi:MAG: hypothetical protein ABIH42_09900 [Planctomycetota bacterium]
MEEPEFRILASFFPETGRIRTTKDIEQISGYSHERVHTILTELEKKGSVIRRKFGRVNVYKLNTTANTLLPYVFFMEKEKDAFSSSNAVLNDKIIDIVSKVEDFCDALVLTRSGEKSKINFLCFLKEDNGSIRKKVAGVVGKNVVFMKISEFVHASKQMRETAINGIVLSGIDTFHRIAYRRGNENAEEI